MSGSNQFINLKAFKKVAVSIKREDLLHTIISGNKFRKLKYNLLEAKKQQKDTLLTFGGAFSNHIAAVAAVGKENNIKTIGIIRGEELIDKVLENTTLKYAQNCGMHLEFISRTDYRNKNEQFFIDKLKEKYNDFYLIPEGGTNTLAIKGCEEILTKQDAEFDYICVSVGTGGTIAGLANSAKTHQKVIGFSSLKGDFLNDEIKKLTHKNNWKLITEYHFGGYGKINNELITLINQFKEQTGIPLDPIYTGKMVFGIIDLVKKNYFKNDSKILIIHTGGLQGINGVNERLRQKGMPLIK